MRYYKGFFKRNGFVNLALLCFALHASAQEPVSVVQQQLTNYRSKALQEKLYVHTDKNFYQAGEIMWFKIYNVDASFHMPLGLSRVVYVEVLDKKNHPVLQAKVPMDSGSGAGSLFIPVTINSGNYILRAYTNWMKNYPVDYFFQKNITLVNSQKITDSIPVIKQTLVYDAQFFPEGGNLVAGLQSKLAYKVVNQYGKGVNFSGTIINENGDSIAGLRPSKFGMGNLTFTPEQGHTYKAVIKFDDGKSIQAPLPAAYKEGYVMHVSDAGSQWNIDVNTNTVNTGNVYVVAQTRQVIKATATIRLQGGKGSYAIDKNKLGEGITQVTLFNEARQPVCERLCFIYPASQLDLKLSLDKEKYANRKKVALNVQSSNKDASSDVSVAVYRMDSLQQLDAMNINNYLWLNSDLKGSIESPDFYFSDNNKDVTEAMDNLMLTQGWRRFKWDQVLQAKAPTFTYAPELRTHIINGKVIDTRTGEPASNIECYLSVPGTKSLFLSNVSDDSGHVSFEIKNMYGAAEIIVQANSLKDSMYRVDISNPFSENYTNDSIAPFALPLKNPATLLDQSIGAQVQNIYTGQLQKRVSDAGVDTSVFYGTPDLSYLLDNYVRFTTMEEVLREYVQFVNVKRKGARFHLDVFDAESQRMMDEDPLVLLDGVPVFDMDKLIAYDPLKVRKLDVLTRKYFFGYSVYSGLLNFITYNGDMQGYELDAHATAIDYESMQMQREFYSPAYNTDSAENSHLPDFRNLLYWNPHIKINAAASAAFDFYTSDKKGKYVIVAEGLSKNGKCGTAIKYFEVE